MESAGPVPAPEVLTAVAAPPRACVFEVAGVSYGFPVGAVREVAMLQQVTPVPRAPLAIRGVANLRGVLLPVVDPAAALGHVAQPSRAVTPTVVIRDGAEQVGLAVESVTGLLPIESLVPSAPTARAGADRFLEGVFTAGARRVRLLDPLALLEELRPQSQHLPQVS